MPRIFTAIEIPDEVKAQLAELRVRAEGIRWTKPEQIHLTLSFVGDVVGEKSEELKSALSSVVVPGTRIRLERSGFFPNIRRPSVFWIGVADNPALQDLKAGIDIVLENLGLPVEKREFKPHVTIARIKEIGRKDAERLVERSKDFGAEFAASSFRLYSSELTSDGAVHTVLAEYGRPSP